MVWYIWRHTVWYGMVPVRRSVGRSGHPSSKFHPVAHLQDPLAPHAAASHVPRHQAECSDLRPLQHEAVVMLVPLGGVEEACPEVAEDCGARFPVDQDVVRVQVAVADALLVEVRHRSRHLNEADHRQRDATTAAAGIATSTATGSSSATATVLVTAAAS